MNKPSNSGPIHSRLSFFLSCSLLGITALAVACTDGTDEKAGNAGQFSGLPQVCGQAADFPTGFDYPQTAAAVEAWVANRDEDRARVHGWWVWAGLNAPAANQPGQPVWRTWCTSSQAFADNVGPPPPQGAAARPADASLPGHRRRTLNELRRANGASADTEDPINVPGAPGYPPPQAVIDAYPQCYVAATPGVAAHLADGEIFQSNGDIMVAGVIYNQPAYRWIRDQGLFLGATLNRLRPRRAGSGACRKCRPARSS